MDIAMLPLIFKQTTALLLLAVAAAGAVAAEPSYVFRQFSRDMVPAPSASGTPTTPAVAKPLSTLGAFILPTGKRIGDDAFALTAPQSNSTGTFAYVSNNVNVIAISGSTAYIVGMGTATITAVQAASTAFNPAAASADITVLALAPIVYPPSTLGTFVLPTGKQVGDSAFALTAPSSNSTGAFTYASSNEAVITVSGSVATVVGAGTSTITVSQAASSTFAAASTSASITVVPAPPSTVHSFTLPTGKRVGDASFVLTAPQSNSAGAFTYVSSNHNVIAISGNTAAIIGAGTATISANQAASGAFGAGTTSADITVVPPLPAGTTACADGQAGCAIWNNADKSANIVVTNDLVVTTSGACAPTCPSQYGGIKATLGKSSGLHYWEVVVTNTAGGWNVYPCAISPAGANPNRAAGYDQPGGYGFYINPSAANVTYSCMLNLNNNTFSWKKNGVAAGTLNIEPGTYFPAVSAYTTDRFVANFGQTAFKYAVPAGYAAGVK